ncbi:hypothetical protein LTR85_001679 [Meristemomyces frigidus]|nr:hypothetical protein LTR85_001679 [Meristemomyces frigidus]
MAQTDWVDGGGWISDESDFYGDGEMQAKYEKKAREGLKRAFKDPFAHVSAKRVKQEAKSEPASTPPLKTECEPASTPWQNVKDELALTAPLRVKDEPASTPLSEAKRSESAIDFLKSRPQVTAMQQSHTKGTQIVKREAPRALNSEADAEDLVANHRSNGNPAFWQQEETIEDFVRRAPVAEKTTTSLGPWLYVSSPMLPYHHKKHSERTDVDAFKEAGELLLAAFTKQRSIVEDENEGKAPATITRKMGPYREQLEDDLLNLAVKTATTCGKWMLFPYPDDLPRTWRLIAQATADGKLGPQSKVATYDESDRKPEERVICVYTYDFTDTADVRRVLEPLVELGLCSRDGRAIHYKCDAYTYLRIMYQNPYKIKASLYSSNEVLGGEVKAKADGPVVRLQKRSAAVDGFLQS